MTTSNSFPKALLSQPLIERLGYFDHKIVAHPRLKALFELLLEQIRHPAGASLIFVYGPTGVGKTTLRKRLEEHLLATAQSQPRLKPDYVPVVGLEAVAPESGNFNWKDYYRRALIALEEPLAKDKIDYRLRGIGRNTEGQLMIAYSVSLSNLRHALEQCLRHRQPQAFFIDEAQHFKKVTSGRRLLDQMDTLKSLASLSGTVHVLLGTYELLDLSNLSAQLSRRSVDLHFARYRADQTDEWQIFKNVILTFQRHLPLVEEPDLLKHADYLYERSAGCVGVLKNWLYQALGSALEQDQATLKLKDLEICAKSSQKMLRVAREIKEGEALLEERKDQLTELRSILGLSLEPFLSSTTTSPATPRSKRVGQRNPTRDEVGR
jgi:energy-coupling factor transporter ATP-binding protein EcfA2